MTHEPSDDSTTPNQLSESIEQVLDTNEFTLLERVDRSTSSRGAERPPANATRETDFEE